MLNSVLIRNIITGAVAGSLIVIGLSCVVANRPESPEPSFFISPDTAVLAHDTVFLRVLPDHGGSGTVIYSWYFDGKTMPYHAGLDTSIAVSFGVRDTGIHMISIKARDLESGVESVMAGIRVTVRPGRPACKAMADTTVTVGDTIRLHAYAADSNGTIESYHWIVGNATLDTATDSGSLVWHCSIHDTAGIRVLVRATDNDGLTSAFDTIRIQVKTEPPVLAPIGDTAVLIGDTLVLRTQVSSAHANILRYIWKKDSAAVATVSGEELALVFTYRDTGMLHSVEVRALDEDSVWSSTVSVRIGVLFHRPVLSVMNDTTVAVNDPVALHAWPVGVDTALIAYSWTFDAGEQSRITHTGLTQAVWAVSDTGLHRVIVTAWGPDSIQSVADTIHLLVRAFSPNIRVMADTTVAINDTIALQATGSDTNGWITRYLWAVDDRSFVDTTNLGLFAMHWSLADTGVHLVRVVAVDDDNLKSAADTIRVTVKPFFPTIAVPETLTIFRGDTTMVPVVARDSNGPIVKYLWEFLGAGIIDSGSVPRIPVYSTGGDSMAVRVMARDDDGLTAGDTIRVRFTANPIFVEMVDPHQDTLLVLPYDMWQSGTATVNFHFRARDSSHAPGSLTFALYLSTQPSVFSPMPVFSGSDTVCAVAGLSEGRYYWKLAAINSRDDSAKTYGSFTTMLQKRLCFTGHSIIVGYGCDEGTGGFRAMVLDSLRAGYPTKTSIKAVGPLGTNTPFFTYLSPVEDDFSLAQGGQQAIDMLIYLIDTPLLSADIWILMIGVNGLTESDPYYTPILIDSMHARNPNAFLYVLNALPLPNSIGANTLAALRSFNDMLVSEIAQRKSRGWNIYLVDAFSAVAPDSAFPTSLMADFVHPNQAGYDVIGAEVVRVMRATLPAISSR